jgi:hypothetical protein
MALTDKHVVDICCHFSGSKACRYLSTEYSAAGTYGYKYLCLKLVPAEKARIDKEIDDFIKQTRKNGQDPRQLGRPLGDNCKGYIYLKYKKQGYNLDKKKS